MARRGAGAAGKFGIARTAGQPGETCVSLLDAKHDAPNDGRIKTRFEVVAIDSLQVENGADKPGTLSVFHRWQDAVWKRQPVSLR